MYHVSCVSKKGNVVTHVPNMHYDCGIRSNDKLVRINGIDANTAISDLSAAMLPVTLTLQRRTRKQLPPLTLIERNAQRVSIPLQWTLVIPVAGLNLWPGVQPPEFIAEYRVGDIMRNTTIDAICRDIAQCYKYRRCLVGLRRQSRQHVQIRR